MTAGTPPEIRLLLREPGIPDSHFVGAMIAMGWPAQPDRLLVKKQDVIKRN